MIREHKCDAGTKIISMEPGYYFVYSAANQYILMPDGRNVNAEMLYNDAKNVVRRYKLAYYKTFGYNELYCDILFVQINDMIYLAGNKKLYKYVLAAELSKLSCSNIPDMDFRKTLSAEYWYHEDKLINICTGKVYDFAEQDMIAFGREVTPCFKFEKFMLATNKIIFTNNRSRSVIFDMSNGTQCTEVGPINIVDAAGEFIIIYEGRFEIHTARTCAHKDRLLYEICDGAFLIKYRKSQFEIFTGCFPLEDIYRTYPYILEGTILNIFHNIDGNDIALSVGEIYQKCGTATLCIEIRMKYMSAPLKFVLARESAQIDILEQKVDWVLSKLI